MKMMMGEGAFWSCRWKLRDQLHMQRWEMGSNQSYERERREEMVREEWQWHPERRMRCLCCLVKYRYYRWRWSLNWAWKKSTSWVQFRWRYWGNSSIKSEETSEDNRNTENSERRNAQRERERERAWGRQPSTRLECFKEPTNQPHPTVFKTKPNQSGWPQSWSGIIRRSSSIIV